MYRDGGPLVVRRLDSYQYLGWASLDYVGPQPAIGKLGLLARYFPWTQIPNPVSYLQGVLVALIGFRISPYDRILVLAHVVIDCSEIGHRMAYMVS